MMILTIVLGLSTKQGDYTDVFLHMHIGRNPNWDSLSPEHTNKNSDYSSAIGMLQYLQGHSRPDITFVVSQCLSKMYPIYKEFTRDSTRTNWKIWKAD
jgi:hypothetical protein